MGKGADQAYAQRASLVIEEITEPGQARPNLWQRLAGITDREALWRTYKEADSLAEQLLVLHRLAQLQEQPKVANLVSEAELEELHRKLQDLKARYPEGWLEQIEQQLARSWRTQAIDQVLPDAWAEKIADKVFGQHPQGRQLLHRLEAARREGDHEAARRLREQVEELKDHLLGEYVWEGGFGRACRLGGQIDLRPHYEAELAKHRQAINDAYLKIKEHALTNLRELAEREFYEVSAPLAAHQAALARSRKLRRELAKPPRLFPQRLDDQLIRLLHEHPSRLAPVFLEGSLLRDHLLYAEWGPVREPVLRYTHTVRIDPERKPKPHPPGHLGDDARRRWVAEYEAAESLPVASDDPNPPTVEEIRNALARHCPTIERNSPRVIDALAQAGRADLPPQEQVQAWAEGSPRFRLHGEVEAAQEEQLIEALLARGARSATHWIELPEYESWTDLRPGTRFTLRLGEGKAIHYVPHDIVGTKHTDRFRHTVTLEADDAELDRIAASVIEEVMTKAVTAEDCVMLHRYQHKPEPGKPNRRLGAAEFVNLKEQPEQIRSLLEERTNGAPWQDADGTWVIARPARDSDLEHEGYWELDNYQLQRMVENPDVLDKQLLGPTDSTGAGAPVWLSSDDRSALTDRIKQIEHLRRLGPQRVSWFASEPSQISGLRQALAEQAGFGEHDADVLLRMQAEGKLRGIWQAETVRERGREPIPQQAPRSERGRLIIEGLTPAEAVEELRKLGATKGACRQVPYELAGLDPRRPLGRVRHRLPQFAAREASLRLPLDRVVVHAITGADDPEEQLRRLERVVESGGLKSIAERRRCGTQVTSLSPLGDIASGIDRGVPCTYTGLPALGKDLYVVLRPQVLERRDMFFSYRDFGGGHDRYPQFLSYARRLGQQDLETPPSPAARQRHLDSGLGWDNELYLRDEVPVEEFDTLVCSEALLPKLKKKVEDWKRRSLLPEHVRVAAFDPTASTTGTGTRHPELDQLLDRIAHRQAGIDPNRLLKPPSR